MKIAWKIGFPLSVAGLVLYFPPLEKYLVPSLGDIGRFGGVVVFAVGWALLLAHLVFHLGIQSQKG